MSRIFDVLHFLRQIFFPNWTDDQEPAGVRKFLALLAAFLVSRNGTGTMFSVILHIFILALLSLIMLPQLSKVGTIDLLGSFHLPGQEPEAVILPPKETNNEPQNETPKNERTKNEPAKNEPAQVNSSEPHAENHTVNHTKNHTNHAPSSDVHSGGGFVAGGGFDRRNPAGRQGSMQSGDCSAGSEKAVEAALEWLAAHQQKDGGWSLSFEDSCKMCSHSGTGKLNRRTAATALALLPFLGAGCTHQTPGRYKTVVERGLLFLIRDPNGGLDGAAMQQDPLRMYSHGLAAMTLCEAFAMTKEHDPATSLGRAAQKALLLIETAQDADGGGWRYRPQQSPGDTSVFAWQLMALKSGKLGGLHVSQAVLYAAQDFLDSVALEGGRRYQYLPTGGWDSVRGEDSPKTCTAIGLLMRMYLGWKPGDPFLDDGIESLIKQPDSNAPQTHTCNLYYTYYATLALHHYGGRHRDVWNKRIQELLIRTQSRSGHEAGSWFFSDPYGDSGGRLLNTAFGAMILETPYRVMPLYRK